MAVQCVENKLMLVSFAFLNEAEEEEEEYVETDKKKDEVGSRSELLS
jgi:hypothetical protein